VWPGSYLDAASAPTHPSVISGLSDGQQYKIQIWVPIWNADWTIKLGDTSNGTNFGNAYTSPDVHDSLSYATPPANTQTQYIFGTFTAVGSTQNLYQFAQVVGGYTGISAFELRAVPEPSTVALLALGGLAFVLRSKFRQRNVTV
jgi:hypothetical protein